ncbi:hypothetical protein MEZE111188_05025 [Mesobacillus zeae]
MIISIYDKVPLPKVKDVSMIEPRYVFSGLQRDYDLEAEHNIKILPKGKYLTIAFSKENEEECRRKMVKYVKGNNL